MVTKKMLVKWKKQIKKSVAKAKKEGKVMRDLPPGLDPDDDNRYILRLR